MTLHLELPHDIERRISQAAAEHSLPVDAYVLSLLDRETKDRKASSSVSGHFSAYLRSLALFSGTVPNYPADFWTREIISGDDDDRHLLP